MKFTRRWSNTYLLFKQDREEGDHQCQREKCKNSAEYIVKNIPKSGPFIWLYIFQQQPDLVHIAKFRLKTGEIKRCDCF